MSQPIGLMPEDSTRMNSNKINELLEKYKRLRKNTPNVEGVHHPLKRTHEQDTLQHLKNKELKRTNTSKPTSKSILSSYEHDEKVTGVDRQMESFGNEIFKNMSAFERDKYKDVKEWYIEKELNRLSKQLKK